MKNKVVSIILTLAIGISLMPHVASAAAEEEVAYENFDNFAFNDVPTSLNFDGLNARVIAKNGTDKALYGESKGSQEFSLNLPLSGADTKMVFSFDAKIGGDVSEANLCTVKTNEGTLNMLSLKEGGRLVLASGKMIGGFYKDTWINYTLVVDFKECLMDLYIDGKLAVQRFKYSYTAHSAPTKFSITLAAPTDGGCANMSLDNVIAYKGKKILSLNNFESKGVSTAIKEFTESKSESVGLGLFLYHTFDEKGNLAFTPNGNTVELSDDPTKPENKVLHIKRDSNTKDAMAEALIPQEMYESKKFVVEFDFMPIDNSATIAILELLDQSGRMVSGLSSVNGIFYAGGTNAGSFPKGKWTNVAIVFDNNSATFDAYMNGVLTIDDKNNSYGAIQPFTVRNRVTGTGVGEYYIDNLHVYTGSKPMDFTEEEIALINNPPAILDSPEDIKELIGTASVFMNTNNSMFINGEKHFYEEFGYAPYMNGEDFMVPDSLIEKAFNVTVDTVASGIPHETKDGILYVSLKDYCEKSLKLYTKYDERGFYMVDDKEIPYVNSISNSICTDPIDDIYRYIFFDRPSGNKILADLKKHTPDKAHPRLITDRENVELIKGYLASEDVYKRYLDTTLKTANAFLGRNLVTPIKDGTGSFLNAARDLLTRVRTYCVAYTFTGDQIYAKGAWREIENCIDKWPDWNETTYFYLDTSETTYAVSLGFDFLYDWLSDEQKTKIIDALFERSLDQTVNAIKGRHKRTDWITDTVNNWSFVCGGGAITACMAIADEVDGKRLETVNYILSNVLQILEGALMGFYPDGGWAEGPGYWQYSAMYLYGACVAPLKYSCGTSYDIMDAEGVRDSLEQTMSLQSPSGAAFNYGDVAAGFVEMDSIGFLVALLCDNNAQMQAWRTTTEKLGNMGDERCLLWYRPDDPNAAELGEMPLDRYYHSTDVGAMRASYSIPEAAYVGVKGGLTALNSHSNLDSGSFVLDLLGTRWADELGFDDYNMKSANYWTEHYKIYKCRPEGQNVIVINPRADDEEAGYWGGQLTRRYAPLITNVSKPRGSIMVFDQSDVYAMDVKDYKRGFLFGDDRQTLIVQDEITMLQPSNEVYWFMHTNANIEISPDKKSAILAKDGKKVRVDVICDADDWCIEDREVKPFPTSPQLSDQLKGSYEPKGMRKLTIRVNCAEKLNITVKFSPLVDYEEFSVPEFSPIDVWDIPDGEIPVRPRATTIKANGVEIAGFDQNRLSYTVDVPYGEPIPIITAENNLGKLEVIQSNDFSVPAYVKVTGSNGNIIVYTLEFRVSVKIVDNIIPGLSAQVGIPKGYKILPGVKSAVSTEPQVDNNGTKLIDGDLTTRWAAEGYEVWAEIDLGEVKDISGVALCIYEGTSRRNIFRILVSEDGLKYTTVFDGMSSGMTKEWDSLMFDTKARYIRYIGNQNDKNTWNSINEFATIVKE